MMNDVKEPVVFEMTAVSPRVFRIKAAAEESGLPREDRGGLRRYDVLPVGRAN